MNINNNLLKFISFKQHFSEIKREFKKSKREIENGLKLSLSTMSKRIELEGDIDGKFSEICRDINCFIARFRHIQDKLQNIVEIIHAGENVIENESAFILYFERMLDSFITWSDTKSELIKELNAAMEKWLILQQVSN